MHVKHNLTRRRFAATIAKSLGVILFSEDGVYIYAYLRSYTRASVLMSLRAVVSAQDVYAVRDLPVHHGSVSVLPTGAAALAELDPAQPVVQRLLRQGAEVRRPAGQGQLLDAASGLREHVRERLLPAPTEALQVSAQAGDEAGFCAAVARPQRGRRGVGQQQGVVVEVRGTVRRRRRPIRRRGATVASSGLRVGIVVVARQRRPWRPARDAAAISRAGG